MTDIVLGIRFTADGKEFVRETRVSREELESLKKSTQEAQVATRTGAEENKRYGESLMSMARFGALAGTSIVAVAGAIAYKTKSAIEGAAALHRMSEQTGQTVGSLQRLKYVEDQLGVTNGALIRAYTELPKILVEGLGPNSEAARALKALGIDPKQVRDADQGFRLIAQRISEVHDPLARGALAQMIFKQGADELRPVIERGAEAFQQLYEKGGQYAGITPEMARQSDVLRRGIVDLRHEIDLLGENIASSLVPWLIKVVEQMNAGSRAGLGMAGSLNAIASQQHFGATPDERIGNINQSLTSTQTYLRHIPGFFAGPRAVLGVRESNLLAARDIALADRRRQWERDYAANPFREDDIVGSGNFVGNNATLGSLGRIGSSGSSGGSRGMSVEDLLAKNAAARNRMAEDATRTAEREADAVEKLRQRYIDLVDPIEPLRRQLTELDKLYEDGRLTAEQYAAATFQIQESMEKLMDPSRNAREWAKEQEQAQRKATRDRDAAIAREAEEWKRMTDDVGRSITDSIINGGMRGLSDLRDLFINTFKSMVLRPIIQPIAASAAGAVGGMLGFPGAASAAGGGPGGGMNLMGMLSNASGLFGGVSALGSTLGGSFGAGLTYAGSVGAMGGLSAAGSGSAAFGLGVALPAVGWALAAYSAYKALTGNKGGPAHTTGWDFQGSASSSGFDGTIFGNAANSRQNFRWAAGAPVHQQARFDADIRQAYADVARLGEMLGRDTSGLSSVQAPVSIGLVGDASRLQDAMRENIAQVTDVLARSLVPNLQDFAQAGETATQTLVRMASAAEQLREQQAQAGQVLSGAAAALPGRLGITALDAFQRSLAVGEDRSPLDRLGAARSQYADLLARAQGGDLDAVAGFAAVAQQRLAIERGAYASGAEYQGARSGIEADLAALIGKQRDVQADLLSGISIDIQQGALNTVAELKKQTAALVDGYNRIVDELRRLREAQQA